MLLQGQDWAKLCRACRHRHGLKQEAMAQDFNVDQSTVSRWERGTREPSLPAKQAILSEMLEQNGSAVAVRGRWPGPSLICQVGLPLGGGLR